MKKALKRIFWGVAGAGIICVGMSESYDFELASTQAELIDQHFPGYEEGFYNAYPKGTLESDSLHPDISGEDFNRGYTMRLRLVFYHSVDQEVSTDTENCVYHTAMWRFPFIKSRPETTVKCTLK